jgi:hypothetical protein
MDISRGKIGSVWFSSLVRLNNFDYQFAIDRAVW